MIGFFLPCLLPTIQNCLNGQYDVSLFSAFTILFLFWSSSIILRKLVSRFSELNKNNDVVILGSSFVETLAYTFRIAFGIMPLKQKFMPWPPYLLPCYSGWVCAGNKTWTNQEVTNGC
jgi:hypothetical protein